MWKEEMRADDVKENESERSILKRRHCRESETLWRKETWM